MSKKQKLVFDWAAKHRYNFASRTHGQYTTDTVSLAALEGLVEMSTLNLSETRTAIMHLIGFSSHAYKCPATDVNAGLCKCGYSKAMEDIALVLANIRDQQIVQREKSIPLSMADECCQENVGLSSRASRVACGKCGRVWDKEPMSGVFWLEKQ